MIPKIIHYCWFSGDPYPELVKRCLRSWRRMLPDYHMQLWDVNSFDFDSVPFVKEAMAAKKYAFAADYIRLYALYTEGRIHLDSDVEVFKSFDFFLDNSFFTGKEPYIIDNKVFYDLECAIMGSEKGHPFLKESLDYYNSIHFCQESNNHPKDNFCSETKQCTLYSTRIPDTSAWKQARFMLRYLYGINGPTLFVERQHLNQLGGFEEKYPMIEDWPIAIRFVVNGWRIGKVEESLVKWRIYGDSISHSNYLFAISLRNAFYYYTMRFCCRYILPLHHYHHWLNNWIATKNKKAKPIGYLLRCFDLVNLKRIIFPIPTESYKQI